MLENDAVHPIYKRLEYLCDKNNIKMTPLCLEITGSRGNLDTWKKGNIRNDFLIKISEKFNVSTDYLLCRTDDSTPPGSNNLMPPSNNLSIGGRLKKLRLKHGLTQEQLAQKVNLTKTDISKYESDNEEPDFSVQELFAEIFGVSVDYLLWINDDPAPAIKKTEPPLEEAPVFVTLQRLQNHSQTLSDKDRERMDRKLKAMFDEYFPEDDEE